MLVESPKAARGPVKTPTIDSVKSHKRSNLASSQGAAMSRAASMDSSAGRGADSLARSRSIGSRGSQRKKAKQQVSYITPRLDVNVYQDRLISMHQRTARERPTDGLKTADGGERTKTFSQPKEKVDYTKSVFDASLRLRGNIYMATMPPQRFFGKEAFEHHRQSLIQRKPVAQLDHRAHR